jgi:hypothetical protein
MATEDFTALSEGVEVPLEGKVVRCPVCGRNGVLELPQNEMPFCLHAQECTLFSDGLRADPTDRCDLPVA